MHNCTVLNAQCVLCQGPVKLGIVIYVVVQMCKACHHPLAPYINKPIQYHMFLYHSRVARCIISHLTKGITGCTLVVKSYGSHKIAFNCKKSQKIGFML